MTRIDDNGEIIPEAFEADKNLIEAASIIGCPVYNCGVNEVEYSVFILNSRINGISRSTRNIGYDNALLAAHTVNNRGFSGVGLTDDGDLDAALLLLALLPIGESLTAGVQKVARARAVDGGNGHGIAIKAQLVELVVFVGKITHAVALVDAGDDGLAALLEHDGDIAVGGGQTRADVAHEDDDVGIVNGDLRLHLHLCQNDIVGLGLDASRVDEDELAAVPFGLAVDAVAGDTGGVLHDGATLADELVKQGGFAYVGSSHNGNDGF